MADRLQIQARISSEMRQEMTKYIEQYNKDNYPEINDSIFMRMAIKEFLS